MEAIEFGYLYKRQFWGQGFATEAATAVVHWGDDAGLETLWARVLAPHHKSMHVLRKVGFQFHQFGPASLDHEHIFRRPRWGAK
jgi:RimJ/RimL family protein N-acetyltransferase